MMHIRSGYVPKTAPIWEDGAEIIRRKPEANPAEIRPNYGSTSVVNFLKGI